MQRLRIVVVLALGIAACDLLKTGSDPHTGGPHFPDAGIPVEGIDPAPDANPHYPDAAHYPDGSYYPDGGWYPDADVDHDGGSCGWCLPPDAGTYLPDAYVSG